MRSETSRSLPITLEDLPRITAAQGYPFTFTKLPYTLRSSLLETEMNRLELLGREIKKEHGTGFYVSNLKSSWGNGVMIDPKYSIGELEHVYIKQRKRLGYLFGDGHTHNRLSARHISVPPSGQDWARLLSYYDDYDVFFKMVATPDANYAMVKTDQTTKHDYDRILHYYAALEKSESNQRENISTHYITIPYPYLPTGTTEDDFVDAIFDKGIKEAENDPDFKKYAKFKDDMQEFFYGNPLQIPIFQNMYAGAQIADTTKIGFYKSNKDGIYRQISRQWNSNGNN